MSKEISKVNDNRNIEIVQNSFDKLEPELLKALANKVDPSWFQRVAVTLYRTGGTDWSPLRECTPQSFVAAIFEGAQLGLNPAPQMGEFWIIPRWHSKSGTKRATFQIGVQGLVTLARRAGAQSIRPVGVYQGDMFRISEGTERRIEHEPNFGTECERGDENLVLVYATADVRHPDRTISTQFEWMSRPEIERSADRSKNSKGKRSDAWLEHYASMAKVRVVGRLAKWLPRDERLTMAIARDSVRSEGKEPEPMIDVSALDTTTVQAPRKSLGVKLADPEDQPDEESGETVTRGHDAEYIPDADENLEHASVE